jgi:hypothetical protein
VDQQERAVIAGEVAGEVEQMVANDTAVMPITTSAGEAGQMATGNPAVVTITTSEGGAGFVLPQLQKEVPMISYGNQGKLSCHKKLLNSHVNSQSFLLTG